MFGEVYSSGSSCDLRNSPLLGARLPPKLTCSFDKVDTGHLPPRTLISDTVNLTMMDATERDSEFIARLPAECPRLRIAKMMWIRRLAAADEARLPSDESKMVATAVPPW